jgi:hypothetical protein
MKNLRCTPFGDLLITKYNQETGKPSNDMTQAVASSVACANALYQYHN